MKKYDKTEFEVMVNNWLIDHEGEMDDIKIGDVYFDDKLGWAADAEDDKCTYILTDDGTGNIRIDYTGTK